MTTNFCPAARRTAFRLVGLLVASTLASATELVINLPGAKTLSRKVVQYRCDANASKVGQIGRAHV